MALHSSPKTLNSKSTSFSSPLHSIKLKTIFQTLIFTHIYRIARAAAKAKPIILKLLEEMNLELPRLKKEKTPKLFFGSFRMHYNWCSYDHKPTTTCDYYDSTWNSAVVPPESDELSSYLEWLEEKDSVEGSHEIDRLADLFIANCHEKFRLEKQESYRKFQEMMDKSV